MMLSNVTSLSAKLAKDFNCKSEEELLELIATHPANKGWFANYEKKLAHLSLGFWIAKASVYLADTQAEWVMVFEAKGIGLGIYELSDDLALNYRFTLDRQGNDVGNLPFNKTGKPVDVGEKIKKLERQIKSQKTRIRNLIAENKRLQYELDYG